MITEKMKNPKILAITATIFLMVSLIGTVFYYQSNRTISGILETEKSRTASLESEKAKLTGEIGHYIQTNTELTGANGTLQSSLTDANSQISANEARIKKLTKDLAQIGLLKNQIAQIQQSKKAAEDKAFADKQALTNENMALNSKLDRLKGENKELAENLDILSAMNGDNFRIDATKRKDRITVLAGRTKKVQVSFELPYNSEADIKFNITRPDGKKLTGNNDGITYIVKNAETMSASLTKTPISKTPKKVEMTYTPKEKLKPGIYQIEMVNKGKHVATCQFKLR